MWSFLESKMLMKKWSNLRSTLTQNMALFNSPDGRTDISLKTPYFLTETFLNLFQKVRIFVLFEALLASPLETNFCHQSPFVSANLVSRIGSGLCTLLPWRPQPVNLIKNRRIFHQNSIKTMSTYSWFLLKIIRFFIKIS